MFGDFRNGLIYGNAFFGIPNRSMEVIPGMEHPALVKEDLSVNLLTVTINDEFHVVISCEIWNTERFLNISRN